MGSEVAYRFAPIAYIQSPFKEKFGIPRQPGLIPAARGRVVFVPPYDDPAALDGLEQCSHLWLQFVFHQNLQAGWQARVRPPRLGGNRRLGVFATRSSFRPNSIGLSVVRLDEISADPPGLSLAVSGLDLLDGTPVLDIKPYVPYADALSDASNGLAPAPPQRVLRVEFASDVVEWLEQTDPEGQLQGLIREILAYDPRPAYKQGELQGQYGMRLLGYDIRWRMLGLLLRRCQAGRVIRTGRIGRHRDLGSRLRLQTKDRTAEEITQRQVGQQGQQNQMPQEKEYQPSHLLNS
ncbi:MAG: tRNA (N6-threonylcarbamoyladenosine(37)-N6)-methyltransferase TrmO [Gammaproteobacteria bacterium]|nr:tRNA (N6-threonylcarbamoyladenosine(37)-N6)-methyltransferase TrmO [Gammaproteobacteria bacterium]